jgi:hypothetical protein
MPIVFIKDAYMYLLETTFVLRIFKILSAPSGASASNFEKMAKKSKIEFFLDFFQGLGTKRNETERNARNGLFSETERNGTK